MLPSSAAAVCRVCLAVDVPMYNIADTPLQLVYEKLTNTLLRGADRRPAAACYVCRAQLHKSRKLMLTAVKAGNILTAISERFFEVTKEIVLSLVDREAVGLRGSLTFSIAECIDSVMPMRVEIKTEPELEDACSDTDYVDTEGSLQARGADPRLEDVPPSARSEPSADGDSESGDSEGEPEEMTASFFKQPPATSTSYLPINLQTNEPSTLDQDQSETNIKMLESARISIHFNDMEPPISNKSLSINKSGLSSLAENLPTSFDSLRELDIDENGDVTNSFQKHVDEKHEVLISFQEHDDGDDVINKAQPDETEEIESIQSHFSPTDGSDLNPDNISIKDEEYGTENELNDDSNVKKTKLSKKICKESKISSKSISTPTETNLESPNVLLMECEGSEGNESQCKSRNTKRSWTRRNACLYCQQIVTNFSRHILRRHANEIEVIKYKSINDEDPKIQKFKRQEITDKIRNKGNFLHNSKLYCDRDGAMNFILTNRRDITSSPSSFVTCKNCLGTFKRSTFYRHFKKCGKKTSKGRVLTQNSITIIPNAVAASEELKKKILPHLRADKVALVVKNDRLILAYGTRLLNKQKERQSRKAICSKMRDLATLLMFIRKHDPTIETLTDALDPEKYEVFIASIKEMCGFDEDTGQVRVPSIPTRILTAVLGCVDILYTQSLMSSESTAFKELFKKKLDDFKQLVTINWQ